MGVPAFFKWLVHKYPKTVVPALEVPPTTTEGGEVVPPDLDAPNPNRIEFDNFYIDLNGLVHPCCHDCYPVPESEEEMMFRIFAVLDEVIGVVRPRRLLYLALDGPAPRAKVNQQRSRRFRHAKDTHRMKQVEERLAEQLVASGCPPPTPVEDGWDPNVITPGTAFMQKLSKALQWYIHERMNSDDYFKKITIIFSDSDVPGEGEHKIMDFVRSMRLQPGYDPQTRHCVYGLDADLIMLGLATHEPFFSIVRDHVDFRGSGSQKGRDKTKCPKGYSNFDFLHCNVVREYFEGDIACLRDRPLPVPYDLERCLDDFIFICFMAGNDFLPALPSLNIREGGLDILIDFYCQNLEHLGGYLTDHGEVDLSRLASLLDVIGSKESKVVAARSNMNTRIDGRYRTRIKAERESRAKKAADLIKDGPKEKSSNELLADLLLLEKENMRDVFEQQEDEIDFHKPDWDRRYYGAKFSSESPEVIADAARNYLVGLQWVARYYYHGTASWRWFYPYHYAPFAKDLSSMARTMDSFTPLDIGHPFPPLAVLLAVTPPGSRHALPASYRRLLEDKSSPIIDMFPMDFHIDTVGKRWEWMGTVILPFIDEDRLLEAAEEANKGLSEEEAARNKFGVDRIYVHETNRLAVHLVQMDEEAGTQETPQKRAKVEAKKLSRLPAKIKEMYPDNMYSVNPALRDLSDDPSAVHLDSVVGGVAGLLHSTPSACPLGGTFDSGYPELGVDPIEDNRVFSALYQQPKFEPHVPALLPNLTLPKPVLSDADKVLVNNGAVFAFIADNPGAALTPRPVRASETVASSPPPRTVVPPTASTGRGRGTLPFSLLSPTPSGYLRDQIHQAITQVPPYRPFAPPRGLTGLSVYSRDPEPSRYAPYPSVGRGGRGMGRGVPYQPPPPHHYGAPSSGGNREPPHRFGVVPPPALSPAPPPPNPSSGVFHRVGTGRGRQGGSGPSPTNRVFI